MFTWMPLALVTAAIVCLVVAAIGVGNGMPVGLGYGLMGVIALVGLWWFRGLYR